MTSQYLVGPGRLVSRRFVVFFVEFPFYLVRGPFPTMAEPARLADYAARNSTNIMTCLLLDLVILGCFMIFTAGEAADREEEARDKAKAAKAAYEAALRQEFFNF